MEWRKSSFSFSNGNCAEVAAWRKSSRSNPNGACAEIAAWRKSTASAHNGGCVEAGQGAAVIGIRDTKQAHLGDGRTVLVFSAEVFAEFTARVKQLPVS